MEGLKPDLDVFDDPRFAEWRPGQGRGHVSSFSEILDGVLAFFLGW